MTKGEEGKGSLTWYLGLEALVLTRVHQEVSGPSATIPGSIAGDVEEEAGEEDTEEEAVTSGRSGGSSRGLGPQADSGSPLSSL